MTHAAARTRPNPWRAARTPLLVAAGLVAAGLLLRRAPDMGVAHGPVSFVALAAALCAVGMPRQAASFGGGYWFGPMAGFGLAMAAEILGCAADFAWARAARPDWARRRLGQRLARLDRALAESPFLSTLTLRLLPVGNNVLLNLLAGVSSIRALPFLAGSAIGYVPQTAVFALLGGGTQVGQTTRMALAAGLFAVSLAFGWALWRRSGWTMAREAP